jgi:hypothetical protein
MEGHNRCNNILSDNQLLENGVRSQYFKYKICPKLSPLLHDTWRVEYYTPLKFKQNLHFHMDGHPKKCHSFAVKSSDLAKLLSYIIKECSFNQ